MKQPDSPDSRQLTLTERLAADRTHLANERTLLSYTRTALGLIVSGTGFSEYLDSPLLRTIFLLLIPVGIIVLTIGAFSFLRRRKELNRYRVDTAD